MAGRKPITDEDVKFNEEMFKAGREDGAMEAKRALESVKLSNQIGLISGRAQAFKAVRLITEFLEWKQIAEIVDNKEFLKIPGVTSVDDYLEALGLGRSTAFNNLKIARTLSPTEIQLLSQVGFTRKDLLGYASLPDEARMEIREGKVINIEKANREEIREVIEQILQENRQVKEEAAKNIEAKERWLGKKEEMINEQSKEIVQLQSQLKGIAAEMNTTPGEVAYCKKIENLNISLNGYLKEIRGLVECEVPGPTAAIQLIALLNRLRMEANHWYQDAYDVHAPADAAPEEEWQQPQ
ncbi:MAG: hypothetical protein CVU66_00595 [Deltaproteobacteria bacterium HGW-Deltaproteobacteria-23]|nr:MAG: hypothetical protein CVU66_00595 [Deltaproteobacteria bacterium HGW-Deltaproteobacteria-23]